jgi:citrate lyase subunit beta/citryl-CoA lyase
MAVASRAPIRPRRSVLYMPGANPRALEKAKTIAADSLIFDCEDSVAPDAKDGAIDTVCTALAGGGYGNREIIIRVNGLGTPWGAKDLELACKAGPDAILVPKINSPQDVQDIETRMHKAGAPARTKLWAMMETPIAILGACEIATTALEPDSRLVAFVMGTNDLIKEIFGAHTPERLPQITALSLCLLAARACGLACIDGVYNDIDNAQGLEAVCKQGAEFGFDGKTLIHPSQVEITNRVFSPSPEDVSWSRTIIAAFDAPEAKGKGVLRVEGKMVELLHVASARRVVAVAEMIAKAAG